MASVVVSGDTSGSVSLSAPAVAGTTTLTLPTFNGTVGLLVSGTAVASTSGTSIDFTGIPAGVRRITVMFQGMSTSGTSPPMIQIGSGSVTTTGYLGSNTITGSGVASLIYTAGFGIGVSTAQWSAAAVLHGAITLSLFNASTNTWVASGVTSTSNNDASYLTSGSVPLSGVIDRVRITTLGGVNTFDAGSINILYE
jgi:hypothetical protein